MITWELGLTWEVWKVNVNCWSFLISILSMNRTWYMNWPCVSYLGAFHSNVHPTVDATSHASCVYLPSQSYATLTSNIIFLFKRHITHTHTFRRYLDPFGHWLIPCAHESALWTNSWTCPWTGPKDRVKSLVPQNVVRRGVQTLTHQGYHPLMTQGCYFHPLG